MVINTPFHAFFGRRKIASPPKSELQQALVESTFEHPLLTADPSDFIDGNFTKLVAPEHRKLTVPTALNSSAEFEVAAESITEARPPERSPNADIAAGIIQAAAEHQTSGPEPQNGKYIEELANKEVLFEKLIGNPLGDKAPSSMTNDQNPERSADRNGSPPIEQSTMDKSEKNASMLRLNRALKMKSLVFHIGIPKTGSSAIQVFLSRNFDALLGKDHDYLKVGEFGMGAAGQISSGNGAFLARCLLPNGAQAKFTDGSRYLDEIWAAIEKSNAAVGILSSEMFVDADPALFDTFLERLRSAGIKPQVIYFVRSQAQFLMSSYVQQIKRHQHFGEPDEFVLRSMNVIPYIKYYSHYKKMCDLFNAENVLVRVFEATQARSGGLFHSVLQALAVDPAGINFDTLDVNTGLSGRDLAIMRALNKFRPRMQFSDFVVQNAQQVGLSRSGHTHNLLSDRAIARVDDFFREENENLAKSYFHRGDLFPVSTVAPAEGSGLPAINDLAPSDLLEFFGGLIVRFDERLAALEKRQCND